MYSLDYRVFVERERSLGIDIVLLRLGYSRRRSVAEAGAVELGASVTAAALLEHVGEAGL